MIRKTILAAVAGISLAVLTAVSTAVTAHADSPWCPGNNPTNCTSTVSPDGDSPWPGM
jgi:hypothetical protein